MTDDTYRPKWSVEQLEGKIKSARQAIEKARQGRDKLARKLEEEDCCAAAPEWKRWLDACLRVHDAFDAEAELHAERMRMADWTSARLVAARADHSVKVSQLKKAETEVSRLDRDYHRLLFSRV